MTDLRTGLVEAMTEVMVDVKRETYPGSFWSGSGLEAKRMVVLAEAALDAALGFLTDNAEAPIYVEWLDAKIPLGEIATASLLAVLGDRGPTPDDVEQLWKELHPHSERHH